MNYSFRTKNDLIEIIEYLGFLPFFKNNIKGFSVEEMCPSDLWFSNEVEGPWEWKGPLIKDGGFLYGKLFCGKAGFVAKRFVPDMVNYRRDGYDFDSRFDDELASYKDKNVFDTIDENKILLSKELKRICNYTKNGNIGFETVITRLQMQTYVCVNDFVYMRDKNGNPYGWGVAEYTTPEVLFGYDLVRSAYKRKPRDSKEILLTHLKTVLPEAAEKEIIKMLESVGVKFEKGLTERDFKKIKEIYGITFPKAWKLFYKAGLPVSIKKDEKKLSSPTPFPIWNDYSDENVERIKTKMKKPYEWLKNDVLASFDSVKPYWLTEWGLLPETKEEAAIRFDELTASAPTLLPVYSHRYVPMLENIPDPPVISTVGRDTIIYGKNLIDYLQNEFVKPKIEPIPFWNSLL